MTLASLFNTLDSPEAMNEFSFANADQHTLINQRLRALGVQVDDVILDPITIHDVRFWLQNHQFSHNSFTGPLRISGSDLTAVDFDDPGQMQSWIRIHADEHIQAAHLLGIG